MDFLTQQFLRAIRAVRSQLPTTNALLAQISQQLQEQIQAINKASDAQQKRDEPPPVIRAEFNIPPAEQCAIKRERTENKWRERANTIIELATLVAVIVYAVYARNQWHQMIRAANASEKAAIAAKEAADTAAKQLELSERPWVDADVRINGPFEFDINGASLNVLITIRNTGHSPAFNTTINPLVTIIFGGSDPFKSRDQVCSDAARQVNSVGWGISLFPNTAFPQETRVGLAKEEIEKASKSPVGTTGKIIWMNLIVCIAYRPTFDSKKVYTTGYIFEIRRIDKNNLPRIDFPIGEKVDANRLRLLLGPGSIVAN